MGFRRAVLAPPGKPGMPLEGAGGEIVLSKWARMYGVPLGPDLVDAGEVVEPVRRVFEELNKREEEVSDDEGWCFGGDQLARASRCEGRAMSRARSWYSGSMI